MGNIMSSKPPNQNQNKTKPASDLAPLLRHFIGVALIIETKHGKTYQGRLIEADVFMNIVLSRDDPTTATTTITNNNNTEIISFHQLHIRGPSIRYIVFGSNVDIVKQIREGRDRERSAGDRYKRGVRKSK